MAGLSIEQDYAFHWGTILLRLDGYDPARNIGYQYVSHADADVVTDHDSDAESTLKELASQGKVRVLVIHDADAASPGDLIARIEEFLASIGLG
jgi:hypothetical protein